MQRLGGDTVTKTVKVTYTENNVAKVTTYPITITNYVDTMVMQTYPTTPKEYIIGANSYDFANVGGTNGKDEVKITWLNGKEEKIDLDSTRLSITDITTLTNNAGTKTATVTLTDGAGNNIKDKDNQYITTTFDIKVGDGIISAHITGDMTKKAYNVGDLVDLSGIKFYEKYGSTPAGNPGTEVTYPNSKITVKDKATGGDFKTELPYTEFDSTTHISNRTVVITFTPDASKPTLIQTKEIPVTIYNQVNNVALQVPSNNTYDVGDPMKTVELALTRKATGSPADMVALSATDFTPNFDTSTPGAKSISYTYTDNGNVDGAKTFPAVTYNYSVNDTRMSVEIAGELTETNKNYNWGETVNLSDLKVYEKFASDTDSESKGNQVPLTDSRITIKDITNVSSPIDVKADLSLPTKLQTSDFNSEAHKAIRTLEITFIADPNGGTDTNNKATKIVNINVLNNLDHIEIGTTGSSEPTKSFSVNQTVTTPGGEIFIYRAADTSTSMETKPIEMAWLNGTIVTSQAETGKTATVTYTEKDAHDVDISDSKTYTYDVVDTSLGAHFEGTFTKNKYDWGEALDLSEIKLYEKFSSTPATGEGSKGTPISLSDITKVKIEDITETPETNITGNLVKATQLTDNYFGTDHWTTTRKARISYTAGNGTTYTKEIEYQVFDTVDHIAVDTVPGDDPKKYVIGEAVTYPVGTYTVYRKSSPNASNEQYPITEALLNNTLKTDVVTTNGQATVTHKEDDAKGVERGYPATLNYIVADVVTKIEIKTPAPKPQVKFGATLKDSDLTGVFIEVYKGGTNPVGDPIQVTASMVSPLDTSTLGDKTVTVTYGQDINGNPVTTTMTIEVIDYVKDIKLTLPSKLDYEVGETLNLDGATVQVIKASEEGKTLTTPLEVLKTEVDAGRATLSGNRTFTAVGTETINVTWNGFTKPINVTVKAATLTPNYTAPTGNNTFKYGNPENKEIDLTGGKIEITNKAGTVVETIDLSTINLDDPNCKVTIGTPDYEDLTPGQTVDVIYDGTKVGEIPITIQDYIKGIKVEGTKNPGYEPGDTIDLTGGYVAFEWASKKTDPTTISLGDSSVTVNGGSLIVGSTLGKVDVPVVYTGTEGTFTGKFEITVKDESRTMTLTEPTGDNTFKYGNPDGKQINKTGGKITVTNKAGAVVETINLTDSRVTFGTPNFTDLGTQNIDVMLDGAVVGQIPITVQDYVMDIILTPPTGNDLVYEVDKTNTTSLKLAGATLQVIKASEAGGTLTTPIVNLADEVAAKRATLGTYDLSTKGPQSISVTWEGKTKSFGITVNDSILSISMHNPPKETQTYGEAIVLTGTDGNPAQIAVTRSSGTTYENITSTMIPGYNPNQLGPQTVTVTYQGKNTTFNVDVKDKITGIKITKPTKLEYEVRETPDFSTGTVEFVYAGGTKDTTPVSLTDATKVTLSGGSTASVR